MDDLVGAIDPTTPLMGPATGWVVWIAVVLPLAAAAERAAHRPAPAGRAWGPRAVVMAAIAAVAATAGAASASVGLAVAAAAAAATMTAARTRPARPTTAPARRHPLLERIAPDPAVLAGAVWWVSVVIGLVGWLTGDGALTVALLCAVHALLTAPPVLLAAWDGDEPGGIELATLLGALTVAAATPLAAPAVAWTVPLYLAGAAAVTVAVAVTGHVHRAAAPVLQRWWGPRWAPRALSVLTAAAAWVVLAGWILASSPLDDAAAHTTSIPSGPPSATGAEIGTGR